MRGGAAGEPAALNHPWPAEYKRAHLGEVGSRPAPGAQLAPLCAVLAVKMSSRTICALLLTAVTLPAACAQGTHANACAPESPRPQGLLLGEGQRASVRVGELVYIHLVVGERFMRPGRPRGFPWASARSSAPAVLESVPVCPSKGAVSTLPVRAFAFRAHRPGRARVSAPLSPAWRAAQPNARPRPFSAQVEVRA